MRECYVATIRELRRAFKHFPRPSSGNWYARSCYDPEDIARVFISQDLESIQLDQIKFMGSDLLWLLPNAFLYCLPRLAELCLECPDESGDLFASLEFCFIQRSTGDEFSLSDQRIDGLKNLMTPSMQSAVAKFLRLYNELKPSGLEPEEYWLAE